MLFDAKNLFVKKNVTQLDFIFSLNLFEMIENSQNEFLQRKKNIFRSDFLACRFEIENRLYFALQKTLLILMPQNFCKVLLIYDISRFEKFDS